MAAPPGARRVRAFTPPRAHLFHRALARAIGNARTVLDVGCGAASPLGEVGFTGLSIGTDLAPAALAAARRHGAHTHLVRTDATALARVFRPRSIEVVVALDVIEHLERPEAFTLLAALETIARRRVVVFTPNGFVPQPPAPDNPHQEHRSGFTVADLTARGYRVRGTHGLRWLSGPYGECRWRPAPLWRRVADLTAPLVWPLPRLAFALFGVKDV